MLILSHSIFDLDFAQTIFLLSTILAAVGLIIIIYSRNRSSVKSRLFILILLLVIGYLISHAFHFLIMHSMNITILDNSCHSFLLMIIVTITFFTWNLPEPHKMGKVRSLLIIIPSVVILGLLWSNFFIEEAMADMYSFRVVYSSNYPLFLLWYGFLMALNFYWLIKKYYKEENHIWRQQILMFFLGLVITNLTTFIFGLFLPWYLGFYYLVEISPLAFLVGVILSTTFAVNRYDMFKASMKRIHNFSISKKIILSSVILVPIIILLVQSPLIRFIFQPESNRELVKYFAISAFGGIVVTISIAFIIVKIISNPLKKLKDKAHEIEKGNYGTKIDLASNDEFGELTEAFNTMSAALAEQKKLEEQLSKSEKLAALGKMAAVLAHEIKTPLTSIKMNADILADTMKLNDEEKENFAIIQTEINRLNNLAKDVLQFSRQMELEFSCVHLNELIENIRIQIQNKLNSKGITFINNANNVELYADEHKLKQVFLNLIENSIEAIDGSGEIKITSVIDENWKNIRIYIIDNGKGLNPDINIFEPFVTTKASGTGLGLSIAQKIIEQHSGTLKLITPSTIEVDNKVRTIFEITLPMKGEKE